MVKLFVSLLVSLDYSLYKKYSQIMFKLLNKKKTLVIQCNHYVFRCFFISYFFSKSSFIAFYPSSVFFPFIFSWFVIYFLFCTLFLISSFVNSSFFCSSLSSAFHTYLINRYYCNTDKVDNERSATYKPFTCISVFLILFIFSFFVMFCIYIYFLSLSFFTYLLLFNFLSKKSFSFQFPLKNVFTPRLANRNWFLFWLLLKAYWSSFCVRGRL